MKKNQITEIDGWGTLTGEQDGKHGVSVNKDGATSSYTCDDLIIAAGAKVLDNAAGDVGEPDQWSPTRSTSTRTSRSAIIGGWGAIGVEFAYVMTNFGVDVTIVEFLDRMVPTEDEDVSKVCCGSTRSEGRRPPRSRTSRTPGAASR